MDHLFIFGTLFLTVYGQLTIKWQAAQTGTFTANKAGITHFLLTFLLNPWVLSSLTAAFLAALLWMIAMTKFDLSYAYPFMGLAFALVLVLSAVFFDEKITLAKVISVVLIVTGIVVGSRG